MDLLAAGAVDALFFAVTTRAAARQLHRRVNKALHRMFDGSPPEATLAIPGQAVSGEAKGTRLPSFEVLWDDGAVAPQRWAAEHSARYLAARVAVGTVDQIALGGLQVKFAHLRGSSLSRALIVLDEVHASDPYMTETQLAMVQAHLELDGHVLLMSATLKETYALHARQIGVEWRGRRYDRSDPLSADLPNQALNHAASAVEAAAAIAVCATATIPQLGFISEDPGQSFVLDVADLYRDSLTIPCAFKAAKLVAARPSENIERVTRRMTGAALSRRSVIPEMIERIKALIEGRGP
jgi:hypothetical protein